MLEEKKDIARFALEYALKRGCQQSKVLLSLGQENELELRDNKINKLHHSSGCQLSMALYVDGAYSSISTNRLDKRELEMFIDKGILETRFLAKDPFRILPDEDLYYKGKMNDFGLYDDEYEQATIEEKLNTLYKSFGEISDDFIISASVMIEDNESLSFVSDSNGFEGLSKRTQFAISAQTSVNGINEERPEDYCYAVSSHWKDLKKEGIASEALKRARAKVGAKRLLSGNYTVLVDRWVSANLFSPLISAMSGEALHQNSSFFCNKKGMKFASEKLSVCDNPIQYGKQGAAIYDKDGVALKKMNIIDNGVLNNYYISQYMSRKMHAQATTGNTSILDFRCGSLTTEELIKSIDKGLLITGFNGGNCNGTTGDFSYGIEGFWVENGIIIRPVNEMLMTGNMLDLWLRLQDLSNDPLPYSSWNVPSLLFDDVTLN